jgi:GH24 family phage-related lysozyme (muramidase)
MPVGKIKPSARGKAAVAGAMLAAVLSGWAALMPAKPTPAAIHAAINKGETPPAVQLAIDALIKPYEGLRLDAYLDIVKVPTICYGETKGVKLGMRKTKAECEAMLIATVINDYYLPLVDNVPDFVLAPMSVQASMISGAYNFGTYRMQKSTTARWVATHDYEQACLAQTAFNKAGGIIVRGLVNRREMGDTQRIGEAELCLSGL